MYIYIYIFYNGQSAFTNFIFSFPFEDFDTTLGFNSGSLYIFI